MKMNFKKLNPKAIIPSYATKDSAGCDLYACVDEQIEIKPFETVKIPTGIAIELPSGTVGLVYARSGLASKRSLAPANKVGVIDCDYRGEIIVMMHNHSSLTQYIGPNERIAQLVITPFIQVEFNEVNELTTTDRGTGGFGSTGNK